MDDKRKICHTCQQPSEKVQICSACKVSGIRQSIVYCSRECQVKDWPYHKELCKSVKQFKIDSISKQGNIKKVDQFQKFRSNRGGLIELFFHFTIKPKSRWYVDILAIYLTTEEVAKDKFIFPFKKYEIFTPSSDFYRLFKERIEKSRSLDKERSGEKTAMVIYILDENTNQIETVLKPYVLMEDFDGEEVKETIKITGLDCVEKICEREVWTRIYS